ncbi:MAG TPA: hypothetical protein VMG41_06020 [Gemmatimonadales bacterium]|nr:hypothetical protein [Gemmatimonadales bacterium]
MSPSQSPPSPSATVRILHVAMFTAPCAAGVIFGLLLWMGRAPLVNPAGFEAPIWIVSTLIAVLTLLGWLWARPRVPPRPETASTDAFWSPSTRVSALVTWALWEGAALAGAAATLVTGSLLTAGLGLVALASLLVSGPSALESRRP